MVKTLGRRRQPTSVAAVDEQPTSAVASAFEHPRSAVTSSCVDASAHPHTLSKDMRFHVLGLGPIGNLLAFNLRRTLSQNHDIVLMFKDQAIAKRARNKDILVEHQGVISKASGFRTGFTSNRNDHVYNMVFNESGRLRLPPGSSNSENSNHPDDRPSTQSQNVIESLFVTCKAYSTEPVLKQLQHRLRRESTVVLCQNGNLAVHERLLDSVFPDPQTRPNFILVSNNHGAWLKQAPFHIVHAGVGTLRFGIVPDGERDFEKSYFEERRPYRRALSLEDIVTAGDDPLRDRYLSLRNTVKVLQSLTDLQPAWEPFQTIQTSMRQKVVVNSVINPITMLLGCRNGNLYGNAAVERLATRICMEAAKVFAAETKARLGADAVVPVELRVGPLMEEWRRVARVTAGNISSMLADLRKGNLETEIEFLNGYLMNLGRRYDVTTPVNASILDLAKARSMIPFDSKL